MSMRKKWIAIVLIVVLLGLLAVTAPLWLPPLLSFVGANTAVIQGLTDLVQLLLWAAAAITLVAGWLRGRPSAEPADHTASQPPTQHTSP